MSAWDLSTDARELMARGKITCTPSGEATRATPQNSSLFLDSILSPAFALFIRILSTR